MAQVRRNDPCPCGSGKKYKNCCMRKDRLASSREVNLSNGEALLLNDLYTYAQAPQFMGALMEAFRFYWGGNYEVSAAGQVDQESVRAMLEWFVHDYAVDKEGSHVIDQFIAARADNYPQEARLLLDAWAESATAILRVLEPIDSSFVRVLDLLREEDLELYSPTLAHNARRGDLAVGRLINYGPAHLMSAMTSLLPDEYEQPLLAYVRNAHDLYLGEHSDADWSEFCRANGHLVNAFLLSSRAAGLRELVGPGTRYRDPAEARDRLKELTREAAEATAQQEREQVEPAMRRTTSGIILPGPETPAAKDADTQDSKPRILIPGRDI